MFYSGRLFAGAGVSASGNADTAAIFVEPECAGTGTTGIPGYGLAHLFVDDQVNTLIGEALLNNRDLRMATLKVQEARAQYGVTDADRYPQLNAGSSGTYSGKFKGETSTQKEFEAGLNLSFDLDFFGRLKI